MVFAKGRLLPALASAVCSKQMCFIMRMSLTTIICMLVSIHLLWAMPIKGQALDEKKITMEASNVTLEKALSLVEKLSGFHIAYASEKVERYSRVKLHMATRSVSATLAALLKQTGLGYQLTDNTIMIVPKQDEPLVLATFQPGADTAIEVKGKVLDETGSPLPGVSVRVNGTTRGVFTDGMGAFTLSAGRGQVLVFTSVGTIPQEYVVRNTTHISIILKTDSRRLEDIVVVGYGRQRKANLTGAVSSVDVKRTLGSRPVTDVGRGLQGAVPGLTITTSSGDLGRNPNIRLRGMTGSLNAGAAGAQPLILVDNVEIPSLQMINPQDIESISVLKDAASASIYGTRGAWGVILITTKSGAKGAPAAISYTNNFSWSKPTAVPIIAGAVEGAEAVLLNRRRSSNNPAINSFGVLGMYFDDISIRKMKEWEEKYAGQDLGDEMVPGRDFEIRNGNFYPYRPWDANERYMKKFAFQQKHDLSVTGGGDKTSYHLGLGYLNQTGMLKFKTDRFDRYNATLSVNSTVKDWLDVRGKMMLSQSKLETPFSFSAAQLGPWYYLYRWPKVYPYGTYQGKPFRSAVTEMQQAKMDQDKSTFTRVQVGATLRPLKDLTIDVDYTYSNTNQHIHSVGGETGAINFWFGNFSYVSNYQGPEWNRVKYTSNWNDMNTGRAFATYTRNLSEDHHLKGIVGMDVDLYRNWSQVSERRGMIDPNLGEINLATGDQFVSGKRGHWATNGYFARINYDYKNKFLLEVNGRYDGSSKFPEHDQFGFFPSVSAGYIISEENFMGMAKPFLSFLKLRGSYGSVGNQNVGDVTFLSVMTASNSNWLIGNNNMITFSTPNLVPRSLTWETISTLDFGLDARFLDNKLGLTFDWYNRITQDMIGEPVGLPATFGGAVPKENFGEMQTRGWELAIDYTHAFNNGIRLHVLGTLSDFQEELTRFASATTNVYRNYQGKKIGEIWGYVTDRLFQESDFNKVGDKWEPKAGIPDQGALTQGSAWFYYTPGDVKYTDINGDGKITWGSETTDDPGDLRVIGNSTPRYQYGIRLGADWKGIDLGVFFQGVGKRELWPSGPIFIPGFNEAEAWYSHQMDYWTPQRTDAFYPRPTNHDRAESNKNFFRQSRYLLDMSYLRLKNVTLGYTLPASLSRRAHIKAARLYVSGENLLTRDHMSVPIDPEIDYTAEQTDRSAFGRVYPYRKEFSFGLQITF